MRPSGSPLGSEGYVVARPSGRVNAMCSDGGRRGRTASRRETGPRSAAPGRCYPVTPAPVRQAGASARVAGWRGSERPEAGPARSGSARSRRRRISSRSWGPPDAASELIAEAEGFERGARTLCGSPGGQGHRERDHRRQRDADRAAADPCRHGAHSRPRRPRGPGGRREARPVPRARRRLRVALTRRRAGSCGTRRWAGIQARRTCAWVCPRGARR